MRIVVLPLILLAALGSPATAGEPPKPIPINNVKQLAGLDAKTTHVELRWFTESIGALYARVPDLTHLSIVNHAKISLDDLKALREFTSLRHLTLSGDMGFSTSHFRVVGSLTQLESLSMSLP